MPRFLRPLFLAFTLLLGGWILSSPIAFAAPQINNQINYQARLMDASGFPVADGNYSIIFSLYDASTAGNRLWTAAGTLGTPTALTVNVQNGLFTVLLGDTGQNTLDTVNWNSDQIYLGVTVNADAEMSPRKRLASAPQAFNARQLQGMYASSTASGGQTLFTLNQTQNDAATGTRSTLDVRSNGTSNSNDFLIRGINDTGSTVFSINRQGSVTSTNVFVSGLTSSTNLNANIASFATATVAGQGICLSDGSFCSSGSVTESDTLASVTNRGAFATATVTLFGGLTTSDITATGTLTVSGLSSLQEVTMLNGTSTNFFATGFSSSTRFITNSGSFSSPSYTFGHDLDTGIFNSGGVFAFTRDGTQMIQMTSSGVNINFGLFPIAPGLQDIGSSSLAWRNAYFSNSVTSTFVFATTGTFATSLTVSGQNVCLANGTNCPSSSSSTDTLLTVSNRGSIATSTLTLYGGFVAASSSVTGTLSVFGASKVTGTVDIALLSTSTPIRIRSPYPEASDIAQILSYSTTGTEGFMLSNYNLFGNVNYSFLDFTKDTSDPLNAAGARISYANEFNNLSFNVSGDGSSATIVELFDNDDMTFGFAGNAAMVIRKYTDNTTSSLVHLWNLGSNPGEATLNVGTANPIGVVDGFTGSIYFRNSSVSGTQAYLNTGGNSTTWVGIATVDMLTSGTSSGPEADTLASVTARGATTTVLSTFYGGLVAASSSVTGTLNVLGNALIGHSTTTLNSQFVLGGNDLYVEGNIGSASSIYTNGEFVVGPSSTHYADGRITKLDGSQELTPPITYGFLMQMTGSFLVQATPDVPNAIPGAIALYAGTGTSTLENGSEITLQGGAGYNDGSGGSVSITGGGSGTSTGAYGGDVYLAGGSSLANGNGGGVYITGADTFGTGNGGSLSMTAGTGYGSGNGGNLSFTAGSSFGVNDGGNITLYPGISTGGRTGNLVLQSGFGFAPPEFRFNEDQSFGSDYVGFRAPTSVPTSRVWILPSADGSSGQVLSTDGAGNLSFITAGGGGGGSNWTYSAASNTYFTVTSTANVVIGGTSTTINGAPLFTMSGDDLLVTGSIGTDKIFASGRVDAPYLNRWFTSPLLTQTVNRGGRADVPVGAQPHGVAFDGSHIWVANYNDTAANSLSKIDPLTNTVVATTSLPGLANNADGMAFDGQYLWVAAEDGSSPYIHKVNVISNQVVASVALNATFNFPQSVAFDGRYIWVTQTGTFPSSSIVSKIDPNTNSVAAEVPVGVSPYGVAFDGEYIWVANLDSATVNKISPTTSAVVATTTGVLNANGVVYDGSFIWVSSAFQSLVYKINPTTAAIVASVALETGANAQHMAFDGTYIWVAQLATTTIAKIDPRINSVVERVVMPGASRSIAVDGSHVWVTNSLFSDFVTKIPYGVGNGAASNLSIGSLLVNSTTGSATGTSNYAVTIAYASATTFGGLCINDTFTGPTCPSTGIGGASIVADGSIIANRFDLAEIYSVTGTHEAGDVLVMDASSTATVKRSTGTAYDSKVIGIASENPGFLLGWGGGAKVALAGRVPVKISMNNGPIQVGDALVSSDVPGYAMKAKQPGMVLGYALDSASATGTVETFVNVGYWSGIVFDENGAIQVDEAGNVRVANDLHVGGRFFPSLKGGGIQDQWYLFVNADDPTSTYISTNADGWMSMDTYDFAERYYSPDELEAGDLVVVSDSGRTHVQRSLNEDDMLLGIVSTRPAFIAGRPATSTFPIALSGRVPTKVSNINGAIKAGDPLAPTSIPGVAAKAVRSGPIVGLALEDFESANIGKIEVFVNPTYWVNESEEVEPETPPEVSSQIVTSSGKQGFATIAAGSKKVRIEFPSLGAYPNVQVTPRGSTGGAWWTDGYSDTGFEIIMQEAQDHDVVFAWRVDATTASDVMRMSDGTYAPVDPVTGLPVGWISEEEELVTEPDVEVVEEPVMEEPPAELVPTVEPESIVEILPEIDLSGDASSTTP